MKSYIFKHFFLSIIQNNLNLVKRLFEIVTKYVVKTFEKLIPGGAI